MTVPADAPVQPVEIDPALAPPPDPALEPDGFLAGAEGEARIHFLDWGGPAEADAMARPSPGGRSGGQPFGFEADAGARPGPGSRSGGQPFGFEAGGARPGPGGSGGDGSDGFDGRGRGGGPGVLLVPGLLSPAWSWAPVARRLARVRRTAVMDLRGHGLSDAPRDGYDLATLGGDAVMVAEASGIAGASGISGVSGIAGASRTTRASAAAGVDGRVVLVGHGFGACVAAVAAAAMGERCAGLVLMDGGFERLGETSGLDADELLRSLEEPPEVLRSMAAWLADRRAFDEASWDADQERAARDAVVETTAGRVVRAVRPFVVAALVPTMLAYDPAVVLASVPAPVTALVAMAAGDPGPRLAELRRAGAARVAAGFGPIGVVGFAGASHNLPRYRPAEVTAAILGAAD